MKKIATIFSVLLFLNSQSFAHSGRTDSNGGHNCSQASKAKGLCTGYHYHNVGSAIQRTNSSTYNTSQPSASSFSLENINYGSISVSRVIRVIDGDTFKADIDEFPDLIGKNISIRISGIDTPEIVRAKCEREKELAIKAKERVEVLLTFSETIVLENLSRDNFFRILADVIVDGVNLGDVLLNEGLAAPYRRSGESPWCA